ncbi:hypothetical protein FGB62_112g019 [Gracilaria domingensis]|nr:hypothetical protein FGB62_112g019 [Gracilaria domingensis]
MFVAEHGAGNEDLGRVNCENARAMQNVMRCAGVVRHELASRERDSVGRVPLGRGSGGAILPKFTKRALRFDRFVCRHSALLRRAAAWLVRSVSAALPHAAVGQHCAPEMIVVAVQTRQAAPFPGQFGQFDP